MSRIALLKSNTQVAAKLRRGYPWIYAWEIGNLPEIAKFPIVEIVDESTGEQFGSGTLNRAAAIAIRRFTAKPLQSSFNMRTKGNTRRLVSGDFDGRPGLFVDRVNGQFFVRAETLGAAAWAEEARQLIRCEFPDAEVDVELREFKKERVVAEQRHYWPFETHTARSKLLKHLANLRPDASFLEVGHHYAEHTQILEKQYPLGEFTVVAESAVAGLAENVVFYQRDSINKEIQEISESRMRFDCVMYQASQPLFRDKALQFGEFGKNFRPSTKGVENALACLLRVLSPGGVLSFTMSLPLGRHNELDAIVLRASEAANRDYQVLWTVTGVNFDCGALVGNPDKWTPVTIALRCL